MSDTLFDMTPYKSEAAHSYSPDWKDAAGSDPAWDEPNLEPNIETRTDDPDGNAPSGWRIRREFIITLTLGQTIEVKFVPGIEGPKRMHQFDFTGPLRSTGFKSHFVLAVESESEWATPADYAQSYAQTLVDQLESNLHSDNNKKLRSSVTTAQAPRLYATDKDNSTFEPAMAENQNPELNHTTVEVVEELSPEEAADRQRLELRVERAFYQAGSALRELRSRRLFRSTHKTFEHYCRERFGFQRAHSYRLIDAAVVMDNLSPNNAQASLSPNGRQILPTNERQVRDLIGLEPDEQRQVWSEAVEQAGGKVPSGRTVKGIVERLKARDATPPPIPYQVGDVVLIRGLGNPELRKYDGHWAIVMAVNEYSVTLAVDGKNIPVKPQFLEEVDPKYWVEIKAVHERITRLKQYELDPMESAGLEVLRRRTCFTPKQLTLLKRMENDYGVI